MEKELHKLKLKDLDENKQDEGINLILEGLKDV